MKKKYLGIVILLIFIFGITGCSKSNSNIKKCLNTNNMIDSKAQYIMPSLESLPEYQNIEYRYNHKSMIIFESESIALIVHYDDKTYESEKDKLYKNYTFLDEKIKSEFDESKYYIPENEFPINGYNFKVVDGNENNNTEFPKYFAMIGTSEDKKSI